MGPAAVNRPRGLVAARALGSGMEIASGAGGSPRGARRKTSGGASISRLDPPDGEDHQWKITPPRRYRPYYRPITGGWM
jgi:hypothetical protein